MKSIQHSPPLYIVGIFCWSPFSGTDQGVSVGSPAPCQHGSCVLRLVLRPYNQRKGNGTKYPYFEGPSSLNFAYLETINFFFVLFYSLPNIPVKSYGHARVLSLFFMGHKPNNGMSCPKHASNYNHRSKQLRLICMNG